MKKLFMIAAIAALGLGAYSCQNGPGDDPGKKPGSEGDTGLHLSLRMPAANNTRAAGDNYQEIAATIGENVVTDVHVWVFDSNGEAVESGHYTPLAPGDFTRNDVTNVWTMTEPIMTTAGDVRIWVGLNLTDTHTGIGANTTVGEFDTEAAMLQVIRDVVEVSDKLSAATDYIDVDLDTEEGIAMFSNARATTLEAIPVGETWDDMIGDNPTFNTVTIPVYRVVSKVVFTETHEDGDDEDFHLDWKEADNSRPDTQADRPLLKYQPLHAFVIQHAKESWMAPHYNVANYNTGTGEDIIDRPITYYYWNETGTPPTVTVSTNISQFSDDADAYATDAILMSDAGASLGDLVDNAPFRYIGENSRVGALNAQNKNTTYAFISTGVTTNKIATWEDGAMIWEDVTDFGYDALNYENGEDIYLVKWDGYDYVTKEEYIDVISTGVAAKMNIAIVAEELGDEEIDDTLDTDDINEATDDPGTSAKEMTLSEFQLDADVKARYKIYIYRKGFVHFMWWINGIPSPGGNNQYEILRNQFVHLEVTGMNAGKNGTFPGYPGDTDDPRLPIDPTKDDPENPNPDPLNPNDPVDPEKTQVLVNVDVEPWTYRWNEIKLGR